MADVTSSHATGADRDAEGSVRYVSQEVTVEATQAANDVIRLFRVPSNAKMIHLGLEIGSSASAGAINVGVYKYNEDGDGAVVDADLFGSAVVITSGLARGTNQIDESAEMTPAEATMPLWEAAGLTEDETPAYLVIAITVSTSFVGSDTSLFAEIMYAI